MEGGYECTYPPAKNEPGLAEALQETSDEQFHHIWLQHRPSEDVHSDSLATTHIKRKQTISKLMGDEKQGLDQIIKIKLNCVGVNYTRTTQVRSKPVNLQCLLANFRFKS